MNERSRRRGSAGRVVLGLFLLALGVLLLADNLGYEVPGSVWSYWPLLLVALGAVKLIWPGDRDERGGGYWLLVVGIYGWIATRGLFGLSWGTAWPLMLIAVGLQMAMAERRGGRVRDQLARIAGRDRRDREEGRDEPHGA